MRGCGLLRKPYAAATFRSKFSNKITEKKAEKGKQYGVERIAYASPIIGYLRHTLLKVDGPRDMCVFCHQMNNTFLDKAFNGC